MKWCAQSIFVWQLRYNITYYINSIQTSNYVTESYTCFNTEAVTLNQQEY